MIYICNMDVNARVLAVMAHFSLSKTEFATRLGVSQGVISHISSGRNNAGLDLIVSLLTEFKEVNPEWMVLGIGDMLRQKGAQGRQEELVKLTNEVSLLNEMNYNTLNNRLETLKKRIQGDF